MKGDKWYLASTFVLSVSLADVAKGGDGAKSALREFILRLLPQRSPST